MSESSVPQFYSKDGVDKLINAVKATAYPNITVIGSPTITNGSVGDFSSDDYLVFPSTVSIGSETADLYLGFTTGDSVFEQQNVLDSYCGLALAVQNAQFVMAVSTNGTGFAPTDVVVLGQVSENTSYRVRISWYKDDYGYHVDLSVADGAGAYVRLGGVTTAEPMASKPLYFGGANPASGSDHIFQGTINLVLCSLAYKGKTVWTGINPLYPKVDATLSVQGAAADAKKVGEEFTRLSNMIGDAKSILEQAL